jgi:hypothetical protein
MHMGLFIVFLQRQFVPRKLYMYLHQLQKYQDFERKKQFLKDIHFFSSNVDCIPTIQV